jgi:hypothetical protein
MATESSVVVALKEVRRLELDRQRREEEARRTQEQERMRADSNDRASVQYGPGMQPFGQGFGGNGNGNGWSVDAPAESFTRPVHRTAEVMAMGPGSGGPGQDFAHPQSYVVGQAAWEVPGFGMPAAKSKSSIGAVLLTFLVCAGGAAGGYWKLNRDHADSMSQMQARVQRAEDLRNEAVAGRSKAEQELKLRMSELETKLTSASAKATAASAALAAAAKNAAATAPEGATPLPPHAAAGLRKGRGLSGRAAAAGAAIKAPAPLAMPAPAKPVAPAPGSPKVAKKKNLSDDPLGGLRL